MSLFVAARPTFQTGKGRHIRDDGQTPAEPPAPTGRHINSHRPISHGQISRRFQRMRQRGGQIPRIGPSGEATSSSTPRQLSQSGQRGSADTAEADGS